MKNALHGCSSHGGAFHYNCLDCRLACVVALSHRLDAVELALRTVIVVMEQICLEMRDRA